MNCYYHIHNQVTTICIAPHQFQCQRKLCAECQDEHGVDAQHMVSIKKFKQMVKQKLGDAQLDQKYQIASQKAKFKSVISSTQNMLKQFWEELSEAIRWIYEEIEIEVNSFNNIINEDVNPTELSNTEIEQLVQMGHRKNIRCQERFEKFYSVKVRKDVEFSKQ
ncbi:unnamed protein product (macronuclear) [Paramecium tetraurelia]|uniref:B box-type domain-containing protein n=1 Tax=Paramecium tetraurelia TaxID=5888 RepID=A0C5X9_PARTE|nr:uncharacterized protein GSPATT00035325001 [Paramecium tetraurelia]CAK66196.1 unnamed protein product [Paramecium tetraurelia]|eukprot:XP_001433593.1 hypothetical protein (macronuclear) [Paramecium tetraurelia strain d4-2]